MSGKVVNHLMGAAVFALLIAVIARIQPSFSLLFLAVFALTGLGVLLFHAFQTGDEEIAPDSPIQMLPRGFGRALLDQMPAALILINDKGRLTYANSTANALVPRLRKGNHYANLFRAPAFIEAVNDVLADGDGRNTTFSLPGQDRVFEAQILALPPGGDFGEATQVIVQIEDRTKDKLSEQMRADFIANASHELRTPLASIIGYIETLQGHAKDDPQARERFLGIMSKQADRMNRLVEDLMSLSRIEMNAHLAPEEVCDIHGIVLEVRAALQPVADKAEVEVVARLVPGLKMVVGDHDQLMQVATNLIDNAIKYGGGAEVSVFEAKANEKYPRMIGISVEDKGLGISRQHLHRLTERFYRTNVAQSRNSGGTGLGLAIVKHILNRHGGELQIESKEGEGSRFTFWVPEVNEIVTLDGAKTSEVDKNSSKSMA